jgi:ornithine cyclodeaminase/alanine dehydrogenase-like protein (mu-crystallin family)
MTIIITDEDVKRLLPMRDCVEAMRVAFGDLANGAAVNRPRVRYLARHPDPERKYLANVHVGAVPSCGIACVRAGSQVIRPPSVGSDRRLYENPQAFNWGIVILYSVETAEPLALMHEFGLSGMRVGASGRSDRARGRRDARFVWDRQAGSLRAGSRPACAPHPTRQRLQPERRAPSRLRS